MPPLRIRYQTIEFGDTDIHVRTLRNRQEYSDKDDAATDKGISSASWPLFGVVWASGELLSHIMLDYEINGLRILEVGCGIGLASLVLNSRAADITATDHHPEAENFLSKNVTLNGGEDIPFSCIGWASLEDDLGEFDLIIGSDILYERGHAELLANFINHHAKPHCKIIIVDPGRRYHKKFSQEMIQFGYAHHEEKLGDVDILTQPVRGADKFRILHYQR